MSSKEADAHTDKDCVNKYPIDAILDNLDHRAIRLIESLERLIELINSIEIHFSDDH